MADPVLTIGEAQSSVLSRKYEDVLRLDELFLDS